jgi:hypothetical protein
MEPMTVVSTCSTETPVVIDSPSTSVSAMACSAHVGRRIEIAPLSSTLHCMPQ